MCSDSLLGLRGCSLPVPTTGLYIDDLGISVSLLGQLNTDQYATGVELFEAKRGFAYKKLSTDILTRLSPMMKADTIIDSKRVGQVLTNSSNTDAALGAGKYGGIRLKIDPNNTSFLDFYLAELSIAIAGTNTDVLVFDMTTGKLIETFVYTTGSIDQFLGKTFKAKRKKLDIAIVYESTEATYKFITKKGSCTDCGGRIKETHICPFVDAVGIELTTDGTTVLTSTSKKYTQGMSLVYNVNCDRESWLCSIGGLMAMPLAYATAVEIYDYALTVSPSQRVNTAVSINRGEKPFATANAIEGMVAARDIAAQRYNDELVAMLTNMRLPSDYHCFDCQKNIKYVTALP